MSSKQQLLGTVAPGRTMAAYRFERETLKRGGPLAVQGKRWTKKPKPPKPKPVKYPMRGPVDVQAVYSRDANEIICAAAKSMRMR